MGKHYTVVVVGAGPTGLTLANLLGAYGIRVLLLDRNAATVGEPRAVSIDDESLRTMQAVGIASNVLEQVVAGYGSEYYTRTGQLFLRVEPTAQPYGYPRRNAFRQPVLEAQLRDALARFPNITTAFSCSLRAFTERPEGVRIEITGGMSGTFECDYLIGCDGASSTVRTGLGVKLEGKSFAEPWLILDLDNAPAPSRNTYVFCDPARPCIALPGPNRTRRFEVKLHPHETAEQILRPEVIAGLLIRFGSAPGSILTRKVVYNFHALLARRWGTRRVFLAGDAAHLSPPFAGQGMNSGVRDAHNLAWKLAFVVSGRLGPGLLDSYETERRDHVQQMIQLALRMGRIMAPANRLSGWLVQSGFRLLRSFPRVRDYFAQMKYTPQPRFGRGFLISARRWRRWPLVGRLLQQPTVTRAGGERVLLDEVLATGFSLLCHATDLEQFQAFANQHIWRQLGMRLVAVAAPGYSEATCHGVEIVVDEDGALLKSLVRYHGQVLLVRPDHYVAAVFALRDPLGASQRFEELVASTWPRTVSDASQTLQMQPKV
jgi:3-(3-hydroxy-phenyl)propionate hydroxylase